MSISHLNDLLAGKIIIPGLCDRCRKFYPGNQYMLSSRQVEVHYVMHHLPCPMSAKYIILVNFTLAKYIILVNFTIAKYITLVNFTVASYKCTCKWWCLLSLEDKFIRLKNDEM